jgi:hypothetical protein
MLRPSHSFPKRLFDELHNQLAHAHAQTKRGQFYALFQPLVNANAQVNGLWSFHGFAFLLPVFTMSNKNRQNSENYFDASVNVRTVHLLTPALARM